jgi:hypothetical protein
MRIIGAMKTTTNIPDRGENSKLESALNTRMHAVPAEIYSATRKSYKPTALIHMIWEFGGTQAAIKLINAPQATDGFWKLHSYNLPQLTAEYIVLNGPWKKIIPLDVVQTAQCRLDKFFPGWNDSKN